MIEILTFAQQHLDGVVNVILPIQQSEFKVPITIDDQPDLKDIPGFYQQGTGNFWIAIHQNEVIGTIALLDIGDGQGALRKMFVKPAFRGSESGVAQRLLQELLKWCDLQQVFTIYLGTTSKFLAAHRFYEKNGFTGIRKTDLPSSFPIMSVDTKFYEYRLPQSSSDDYCQTAG